MKKNVMKNLLSRSVLKLMVLGLAMFAVGCGSDAKESATYEEDVEIILRDEASALSQTMGETVTADDESKDESMSEEGTEEETTEEAVLAPQIEITPLEEIWYTEDGLQELLSAKSNHVTVTNEGFDVLKQALEEWSQLVYEENLAMAEEYASWAAESYSFAEPTTSFTPYYTIFDMSSQRVDDAIVSLKALYSDFTGGAHGNYAYVGYTFDVDTGEILTLDKVIADDEGFQATAIDRILETLESEEYVDFLFSDYEATVRAMFAQEGYVSWHLNPEGIVITVNPYEVGSYAMGAVDIVLPYEEFASYMALKYRPE